MLGLKSIARERLTVYRSKIVLIITTQSKLYKIIVFVVNYFIINYFLNEEEELR